MFDWLKPKTASPAELEQQQREATKALEDARATTASAVSTFDDDPSPIATKALAKAREAEASAAEHTQRAERLLAGARKHEAAEKKAALLKHEAELERSLELAALTAERAPSLDAVVAALLAAADAHAQRCEVERVIFGRRAELQRVRRELGEEVPVVTADIISFMSHPSEVDVGDALAAHAVQLERSDPRSEFLFELRQLFRESQRPTPVLLPDTTQRTFKVTA